MASMLELRGAISLLQAAQRKIPSSGWRGGDYYETTPAEKDAWMVLEKAMSALYIDLNEMLRPVQKCDKCGQVVTKLEVPSHESLG